MLIFYFFPAELKTKQKRIMQIMQQWCEFFIIKMVLIKDLWYIINWFVFIKRTVCEQQQALLEEIFSILIIM